MIINMINKPEYRNFLPMLRSLCDDRKDWQYFTDEQLISYLRTFESDNDILTIYKAASWCIRRLAMDILFMEPGVVPRNTSQKRRRDMSKKLIEISNNYIANIERMEN